MRLEWIDRLAMLAIALIPAIYAAATWDHGIDPALRSMRQFGWPTLLIELLLVGWCVRLAGGLQPLIDRLGRWAALALLLVIMIALLSAVLAQHPVYAILKTVANLLHLVFGLALCWLLSTRWAGHLGRFVQTLLAGFSVYLAIVLAYVATAPMDFNWLTFGMTAQNIRNLGSHMMTLSAFALGAAMVMEQRWRGAAFLAATIAAAILFWSGSRGPFLALVVALLVGCAALPRRRAFALFALGLASSVAGALLSLLHHVPDPNFGLWRTLGLASAPGSAGPTSGRTLIWRETIEQFGSMPLQGYGDGQFITIVTDLPKRVAFPHNVELQLIFQWGWIGGLLAIGLIALLLFRSFIATRDEPGSRLPALMVLAALFALGQLDGPFYDTLPMSFFAIAAAICLARKENPPTSLN